MKLTLQEKIERDLPLNIGEICEAEHLSRYKFKLINPPMTAGKCRLTTFRRHFEKSSTLRYDTTATTEAAAESSDLQTTVRKLRGLLPTHGLQAACSHLC